MTGLVRSDKPMLSGRTSNGNPPSRNSPDGNFPPVEVAWQPIKTEVTAPAISAIIIRWTMANLLDCPPANPDGNFNIARQQGAKHEKVIGNSFGPAGDGRLFISLVGQSFREIGPRSNEQEP